MITHNDIKAAKKINLGGESEAINVSSNQARIRAVLSAIQCTHNYHIQSHYKRGDLSPKIPDKFSG